ncbi:MAG: DinB family protein, partial [Sneathiella sp.]|nr:DinB family protein [Sneathiella sp.]
MTSSTQNQTSIIVRSEDLLRQYQNIRSQSLALISTLSDADATVQSMADASPAKWHMGHTTWFFETLILIPNLEDYQQFDQKYHYLFNSYYESLGPRQPRPKRGMLTRPSLDDIREYRRYVDHHVRVFLDQGKCTQETATLLELGLHHEMQHQELLLTDILHLFAQNPLQPTFRASEPLPLTNQGPTLQWLEIEGGIVDVGHSGETFAFDCEMPLHQQIIRPFKLANRPVTNGEWITFMEEDGYSNPLHWLSDGWAAIQEEDWHAPLYWSEEESGWGAMSLRG